eukprot:365083-Chlamydomonas_euryale.AAC.30
MCVQHGGRCQAHDAAATSFDNGATDGPYAGARRLRQEASARPSGLFSRPPPGGLPCATGT